MISFDLFCDNDHEFEAWFASSEAYDTQKERGLVTCPDCGSTKIEKALMAPAVSTARKTEKVAMANAVAQHKAMQLLQNMAREAKKNGTYVGDKFAKEARKIHEGETKPKSIYGEATHEEVKSLIEDGVSILPLPELPEDKN